MTRIRTLRELRDHLTDLIDGEMGRLYNVGDLLIALNCDEPDNDAITVTLCDPQESDGYAQIHYE